MAIGSVQDRVEYSSPQSLAERVDDLYIRHHQAVYGIALNFAKGSHVFAEDVTQDVFFRLLEKLPDFADEQHAVAWLRRVAVNRCISLDRRRKLRESPYVRWMLRDDQDQYSAEAALDVSAELKVVWAALDSLKPKERAAFCLRHFEGLSQTKIAESMGHSEGYISKLMARAHDKLRVRLKAHGHGGFDHA